MKFLSDTVSLKRFGYLDRDSNFKLVYESGESDTTLYPGTLIQTHVKIVSSHLHKVPSVSMGTQGALLGHK